MEGGQRLIDMLESLFHWLLQSAESHSLPDSAEATPVGNGLEDDEGYTEVGLALLANHPRELIDTYLVQALCRASLALRSLVLSPWRSMLTWQ